MRIRRIQLIGLAAAVIGAATGNAQAEDLTISTATTTPVSTSDPVAAPPVAAGNVTIASGGSIAVTTGAAVTMDSANNVTTNAGGSITSNNGAAGTTGILITNAAGGAVVHGGTITLTEDNYTLADTDNDGNLDGSFALGTDRDGIDLISGASITSLTSTGVITIEGGSSAAMRLSGQINGVLDTSSTITVAGDNSYGIYIGQGGTGGVTGNALIRGSGTIRGTGSEGIVVDGVIGGQLHVNGTWTTTGYHSTVRPADQSTLDIPDDFLQNGAVLDVRSSVLGGILIEGVGVEDDPDDDLDGITETTGDPNDDLTATLRSLGSAPAVLIQAGTSDITLGDAPGPGTFGFNNRGLITADTIYDSFAGPLSATGVRILGSATNSVFTGGIANDGDIVVLSHEGGSAYGVVLGLNADVPLLQNRGSIAATAFSDDAASDAIAIRIDAGASVPTLTNSGTISAQVRGEDGGATAILDSSGTLTSITNTGAIIALVTPTDSDLSDNVVPVATGPTVAIDVSNAASAVTLTQTVYGAELPLDDDLDNRPDILITGDILLSNFGDTFNLETGLVAGDLAFGNATGVADTFNISGGAIYQGVITHGSGDLNFNVTNGTLGLSEGTAVTVQTALIGDNIFTTPGTNDAILRVAIDPGALSPLITATSVTFGTDAEIVPIAPSGLVEITTPVTFLTAASMTGAANVVGPVASDNVPFIYDFDIVASAPIVDGAANSLGATFTFKSAADLGLTTNEAIAFDPIIEALRTDSAASDALLGLNTASDFANAYDDLMPSYASGATELAATAIQQMQGATSNRLAATRLHDLHDTSAWAQEIGYALTREPPTANGQEFRGHGFGVAAGIDGPLNSGGLFGLSASFITSEVDEAGRPEGEISATFGQVNAYLGTAFGPVDLDFIGGLGAGKLKSRRFVEIGEDFNARTDADWWGYEGHGAVRASVPFSMTDWLIVTPQAALTYVALQEQGYTEEGGGTAIDYDVGEAFSQRLWGDVGVEFGARLRMRGENVIAPRLFVGYRANLIDDEAERDFRFVSGTETFTLTDESLGDGGPLVGIGIDATNGYSTLSLSYEGEFGDQIERHSLNAAIRFRF